MSTKLYSRVSNFDDIEPLVSSSENEPFQSSPSVSFGRSEKTSACKKCLIVCLLVFLLGLALSVVLGVLVPLGIAERLGGDSDEDKCTVGLDERFDCLPGLDVTNLTVCLAHGCCWEGSQCFYSRHSGYSVSGNVQTTVLGQRLFLEKLGSLPGSPYGSDVKELMVEVSYETDTRLHIKITDAHSSRFEVPLSTPKPTTRAQRSKYNVDIVKAPVFSLTVSRVDTGEEIFELSPGLVFADQFLQMATYLPSGNVYGVGEHAKRLRLDTNYTSYSMFASDIGTNPYDPSRNLYGVHPFYMCLEYNGLAHGVFLLNSNAMEVFLTPKPSLTFRTIGGVLDFYLFIGPSPDSVVQQYTEVIGRPLMPPYWALGFHLCRWGYGSANNTLKVVQKMRELDIPQDVQWNDIDYMDRKLVFTYDHDKFRELPDLVADLHQHGQKYIIIADPGISNTQTDYPPYDAGLAMDIFIKNSSSQPIVGKVWPNNTVYPDFTHPLIDNYWTTLVSNFHKNISFDGLWIDMNEPSNFGAGSVNGCYGNSSLDRPHFLPDSIRAQPSGILTKTLCMSSSQHLSSHYNLHSLYGHTEAVATKRALDTVIGKRSLVISRSTFAGSGRSTGHWLGDNSSQWKHMLASIAGILDFSLFGIPLVGADICGFFGDTTEELCTRWHQLGAFYPFSRNHNTFDAIAQDPTVWSSNSVNAIRDVLKLRYKLLPYLNTLFHWAHMNGTTVARPLFFEFPTDNETWSLDTQFMWGSSLLITPVVVEGAVTVDGYFPEGRWFQLRNGSEVKESGHVTLDAPISTVPVHVRGGSILPMQEPASTTTLSRGNPFSILVAMDTNLTAEGDLFLDDGETMETVANGNYTLLLFTATQNGVNGRVLTGGYNDVSMATFKEVVVYGLKASPVTVSVNKLTKVQFDWSDVNKVLTVRANLTNINKPFSVEWSYSQN